LISDFFSQQPTNVNRKFIGWVGLEGFTAHILECCLLLAYPDNKPVYGPDANRFTNALVFPFFRKAEQVSMVEGSQKFACLPGAPEEPLGFLSHRFSDCDNRNIPNRRGSVRGSPDPCLAALLVYMDFNNVADAVIWETPFHLIAVRGKGLSEKIPIVVDLFSGLFIENSFQLLKFLNSPALETSQLLKERKKEKGAFISIGNLLPYRFPNLALFTNLRFHFLASFNSSLYKLFPLFGVHSATPL